MLIAIQGERGSNSHMAAQNMAAQKMLGEVEVLACAQSGDVAEALLTGRAEAAVLPIENSLHGSVAEHYDLLLEQALRIDGEGLLRIRHNILAAPGVALKDVRRLLSHPVALSQCRRYFAAHRELEAVPFYDTAGSVKHVVAENLRDTAAIAPLAAAAEYGADVLAEGIEDNAENYTRFHLLRRADAPLPQDAPAANKLSLAFSLDHRPGTLVAALQALAGVGADLTKIESRPVHGSPWEYIFFVDLRFSGASEPVVAALAPHCSRLKVLGVYAAAA
jgi:prephenate dehydratase